MQPQAIQFLEELDILLKKHNIKRMWGFDDGSVNLETDNPELVCPCISVGLRYLNTSIDKIGNIQIWND